ncbi:MAG: hypothetical protein ACOYT4_00395 [Nanoarchaeota archaeon]
MENKNLKFDGYVAVVPNEIYRSKKIIPLYDDIKVVEIMTLKRLEIKSQQQVLDFIQQSIEQYLSNPAKLNPKLVESIKNLPEKEIHAIKNKESEILEHLTLHDYPNTSSPTGYLIIKNGWMENKSRNQKKIRDEDLIQNSLWSLYLQADKIFDKHLLETFIENKVTLSQTLSVSGNYENYSTVADEIRIIYNTLDSPEKIFKITDISQKSLEDRVSFVIASTATCLAKEGLAKVIFHGMQSVTDKGDNNPETNLNFSPNEFN